jgi:uncharacterized protein
MHFLARHELDKRTILPAIPAPFASDQGRNRAGRPTAGCDTSRLEPFPAAAQAIRRPARTLQETPMSTLSMSQASAPRFTNGLKNLSAILAKGAAHAEAKKIDPSILLQARLFPDMFALTRQVQVVSDTAKGCVARLAGLDVPRYEDNETSFDDLQTRITKTLDFIASVPTAQIDGTEDKTIVLKLGPREVTFTGLQYLCGFAIPNFYFHATTAYGILRHNGVELAKSDFIGQP